jgi:hypothetical protein
MKQHAEKCASYNGKFDAPLESKCNCDGYHSIPELYEHRITLWMALCKQRATHNCNRGKFHGVWRSKRHSDGELALGGEWFVLGIGREKGKQITYHLPMSNWDECDFAETFEKAPEFDGHTSDDVLDRLKSL